MEIKRMIPNYSSSMGKRVEDMMVKNPISVTPDMHILNATARMTSHRFRRIPVTDADGKLVGVYAFSTAPHVGAFADPARIYMLSDFAVAPSDYSRLSKLVLYAALSTESRLLAERSARRR